MFKFQKKFTNSSAWMKKCVTYSLIHQCTIKEELIKTIIFVITFHVSHVCPLFNSYIPKWSYKVEIVLLKILSFVIGVILLIFESFT